MPASAFERAKKAGYLVLRPSERRNLNYALWYYWCKENKHPFVVVKRAKKYSRVTFDLITTDYRLREKHRDALFQLWQDLARSKTSRNLEAGCGIVMGEFPVPVEIDETMATELLNRLLLWRDRGEVESW
jgi:hypothetical protein